MNSLPRSALLPAAALLLAVGSLSSGCGDEPALQGVALGRAVYERSVGGLACADCHGEAATPRANPDWIAPGHPLAGVATRPSLWGGRLTGEGALLDAALLCAARFQYRMVQDLPRPEGARVPELDTVPIVLAEREALAGYLSTFAGPADRIPIVRTDAIDAALDLEGDWDRGEDLYRAACAVCHGDEGEGGLGPSITGDDALDPFGFAEYLRTGSGGSPEWMPWFAPDRLSDQQLADLIARWTE